MFRIAYVRRSVLMGHGERQRRVAVGQLCVGPGRLGFCSPLDVWSCKQYENQWELAIQQMRGMCHVACFVTGVFPIEELDVVEIIASWRVRNEYILRQCVVNAIAADWPTLEVAAVALGAYSPVSEEGIEVNDDLKISVSQFMKVAR